MLRIASLGAVGLLALYYFLGDVRGMSSLLQSGFTDDQIKQIEQSIKDKYVTKMSTSSSAAERYQIASGSTTVTVRMLKVSTKRWRDLPRLQGATSLQKNMVLEKSAYLAKPPWERTPKNTFGSVRGEPY